MYYVCMLQATSEPERFYLGSTIDLRQRLRSHNNGDNKATKSHTWRLVYYEAYLSLKAAREREHRLKHDGRAKRYLMQRIKASLEDSIGTCPAPKFHPTEWRSGCLRVEPGVAASKSRAI